MYMCDVSVKYVCDVSDERCVHPFKCDVQYILKVCVTFQN